MTKPKAPKTVEVAVSDNADITIELAPVKTARKRKPAPGDPLPQSAITDRSPQQNREALRRKVKMFYDLQRMRTQCAGRTEPKADDAKIQLHEIDLAVLAARGDSLAKAEAEALKDIKDHLETIPLWTKEINANRAKYRGLGPTMAAVIIAENDIHRQDTVSKMWSFAGLRPMPFRACVGCGVPVTGDPGTVYGHPKLKKGETCWVADREREFRGSDVADKDFTVLEIDTVIKHRAARPIKGEKLAYNAFLRTRLVGVLGGNLLKAGSPYRSFYDNYKTRKQSAGWGKSDAHRHNAAIRYMVKMLLIDIHKRWRELEGLPVRPPYQEEYLGHKHHEVVVEHDPEAPTDLFS